MLFLTHSFLLITGAALRFSLMSLAYLLLVLAIPLLPAPTIHTMRGEENEGRMLRVGEMREEGWGEGKEERRLG